MIEKVRLSDVVSYSKGQQINGDELIENGKYIYLNGGVNPSGCWTDYNVEGDTVTISEGGNSCGYVNYISNPFWCGAHCYYLYDSKLNNKYLYYALKSQQDKLMKLRSGACMPNIKKSDLGNFEFFISEDVGVQKDVVFTLDKITDLITQRKQQLSKLDDLVKARFVEMFGTLNGNEKCFDIVSIEKLCILIKDGTHQTPIYTNDKQNGVKFLSSKDIMTQKICWDDIKYISAELHKKLYATVQPMRNDVLMSKNGVNYGVAAVNDTDEVFDIYVSLALLRPKIDIVNPVYLRCAINTPDTKRQFDSSIKGIGVPNLHLSEIKKTKVLLPPVDKRTVFVSFVEQTDKSKLEIQKSLEKLEMLKKALMQEYFG